MTSHISNFSFTLAVAGLLAISAGAQTTSQNHGVAGMEQSGTIATLTISAPPGANCPVAMSARHGVDGSTVAVSGKTHHGIGQQIELTLNNSGSSTISAIRITVHGWNGNGRTLPAAVANSKDTTASRALELKVNIAPHASTKTGLWVSGLTSVDSIDLLEVHYVKGLNWRAPAAHACRIIPDGEMLISYR